MVDAGDHLDGDVVEMEERQRGLALVANNDVADVARGAHERDHPDGRREAFPLGLCRFAVSNLINLSTR